jgi:hypothetical protein
MMALKAEPPGTACMGWLLRKMMSSTVSPMAITFLIALQFCGCKDTNYLSFSAILGSQKLR